MPDDHELIQQYLEGSEEAFRAFYDAHRGPLYVYLLSLLKTREAAEELLQETFIAFLRQLERTGEGPLDGRESLRAYLLRTAWSRAVDWLRSEGRRERARAARSADPYFRRDGLDLHATGSGRLLEVGELEAALRTLPDAQREAVVLHVLGGLTFREIGRLTAAPENTAVTRYRRGLERLREALGRDADPRPPGVRHLRKTSGRRR